MTNLLEINFSEFYLSDLHLTMARDSSSKVRASKAVMEAVDKLYESVPGFEDVFTETSFYIFAGVFTVLTIIVGIILSNRISIKDRS